MSDLQSAIESILIKSNDSRIDDEVSNKRAPIGNDESFDVIGSTSSFNSAHVKESDIDSSKESINIEHSIGNVEAAGECNPSLLDRVSCLIPNLHDSVNFAINDVLCDSILKVSKKVSKIDFNLKLKDSKTIVVVFGDNKIEAELIGGEFISGREIIYVDCSDLKVDFLILRNIKNNELKDITAQYRIRLNNELVPFG